MWSAAVVSGRLLSSNVHKTSCNIMLDRYKCDHHGTESGFDVFVGVLRCGCRGKLLADLELSKHLRPAGSCLPVAAQQLIIAATRPVCREQLHNTRKPNSHGPGIYLPLNHILRLFPHPPDDQLQRWHHQAPKRQRKTTRPRPRSSQSRPLPHNKRQQPHWRRMTSLRISQ